MNWAHTVAVKVVTKTQQEVRMVVLLLVSDPGSSPEAAASLPLQQGKDVERGITPEEVTMDLKAWV
jgi:hypothetical protein